MMMLSPLVVLKSVQSFLIALLVHTTFHVSLNSEFDIFTYVDKRN